MSLKFVKDSTGKIVAFGPDDDNYDPFIPPGHKLEKGEQKDIPVQVTKEVDPLVRLREVLLEPGNYNKLIALLSKGQ